MHLRTTTHHARGFTLTELLVVIGVVVLLVSILIPTISGVVRSGRDTAQRQLLATIERALDAYRGDHNDIPRFDAITSLNLNTTARDRGARLLARALVGPAPQNAFEPFGTGPNEFRDGHPKVDPLTPAGAPTSPQALFGFKGERQRVPSTPGGGTLVDYFPGQTYGPYLDATRVNLRLTPVNVGPDPTVLVPMAIHDTVILDNNDYPVLYYPARASRPNVALPDPAPPQGGFYVSTVAVASRVTPSLYNDADNTMFASTPAIATASPFSVSAAELGDHTFFRALLGDADHDGRIRGDERAVVKPYLLIATSTNVAGRSGIPNVAFGQTGYDDMLTAMGLQYSRNGVVTNFDAERSGR